MYIKKIVIKNFKKFTELTINPNMKTNVLIGDNESGKSTILEAIDIVSSASYFKISQVGLSELFNKKSVQNFLNGTDEEPPMLEIDLYLSHDDCDLEGKNNVLKENASGIRFYSRPAIRYMSDIKELSKENNKIPFELYETKFTTFADVEINPYRKYLKTLFIDSSKISNTYSTRSYAKNYYENLINDDPMSKAIDNFNYRVLKKNFELSQKGMDDKVKIGLSISGDTELENSLTIYEGDIDINNKGSGKLVEIKTELSLSESSKVDVILAEEIENHLSSHNFKKILNKICGDDNKQIFVSTHNNFACARLELKNAIFLSPENEQIICLQHLDNDTSEYFCKAPYVSILDYVLSKKCILLEGPSEFILIEKMYSEYLKDKGLDNSTLEKDGIEVLAVRGLSFIRYLEVGSLLNIKTAVITDNDSNYEKNIKNKYINFESNLNIAIFSNEDNDLYTFEVCLANDNEELLQKLFKKSDKDELIDYMKKNKTDVALTILNSNEKICVPSYIKEAFEWIRN